MILREKDSQNQGVKIAYLKNLLYFYELIKILKICLNKICLNLVNFSKKNLIKFSLIVVGIKPSNIKKKPTLD